MPGLAAQGMGRHAILCEISQRHVASWAQSSHHALPHAGKAAHLARNGAAMQAVQCPQAGTCKQLHGQAQCVPTCSRYRVVSSGSLSAYPTHKGDRGSQADMQAGLHQVCTCGAALMSSPALTCLQRVQANVGKPWHPSDMDTRQQREAESSCGG